MKSPTLLAYGAALFGSIVFGGCTKAPVEPELTATTTQDAAPVKERGIEVRVSATLLSTGQVFNATLRVESFVRSNGPYGNVVYAQATLNEIGGLGQQASNLEGRVLQYNVLTPNDYYAYNSANLLIRDSFTFNLSGLGSVPGVSNVVALNGSFPITLDANIRKFKDIEPLVGEVVDLWRPDNDPQTRNLPLSELNNYGYDQLLIKLNAIAQIVGRY